MTTTAPPRHLSMTSADWFRQVVADYELGSHHIKLLTLAAEALDRAEEARAEIAKHGAFYTTKRGEPRAHPAVIVERDARIAYARLLRELALDTEQPDPERRPPRIQQRGLKQHG